MDVLTRSRRELAQGGHEEGSGLLRKSVPGAGGAARSSRKSPDHQACMDEDCCLAASGVTFWGSCRLSLML